MTLALSFETLILRHMIVQFTTEQGRNPFKNAIIAASLNAKKTIRMAQCFTSFAVKDWPEFLNLVNHACAECSRDHRGQWMVERTPVSVHLEDGRTFSTYIWYDPGAKGLRYVSLY